MGSQSVEGDPEAEDWTAVETRSADLGDERLNRRLELMLRRLADQPEKSIPAAFRGWGETQAAYRFFDNEKVTPEKVLEPHREATLQRVAQHPVVLCVEDTSDLDFTSKTETQGMGPLSYEFTRGINIHPMLAVTPAGLCLGVLDLWRWVRDPDDHGGKDRQHRLSRPLAKKESLRWVEGYKKVSEFQQQVGETRLLLKLADLLIALDPTQAFLFRQGPRQTMLTILTSVIVGVAHPAPQVQHPQAQTRRRHRQHRMNVDATGELVA